MAGHVARQDNSRWTKHLIDWRPRPHKRSVGRPQRRWLEDIKQKVEERWQQLAQDGER